MGAKANKIITYLEIVLNRKFTSCGCSKFLPQHVSSHAARDVKVKNCSPGFVGRAKKCLMDEQ